MSPNFLPLTEAGVEQALDLRRQLYLHEDLFYEDDNAGPLLREMMNDSSLGALWLIEAEGATAGYLLLTVCYSLEFGGRFGLLDEFYVAEKWRGKGFGRAALEFLAGECRERGLKALRLEVTLQNEGAQALYRRNGFAVDSRHLMTKWL